METPVSLVLREKGHDVYTVSPHTQVYDCVVKMQELNIGALVVTDEETIVGIISERDIIQKIIGCKCDPTKIPVKDIMTTDITTITPAVTVHEAMRIITNKRFRHLPVVENNKLVGMISIGDLTKWTLMSQKNDIDSLTNYIAGER